MTSRRIEVHRAQQKHISALAELHYMSLRDDFLPSLGLSFLKRVYYPAALESQHAVTLVVIENNQPVGFVTIASDSDRFTQDILRGRLHVLAAHALRRALREPYHLRKSLEVFWSSVISKPDPIKGEIVFIAVDQVHRGQGIGKKLVLAALDYLCQKGVQYCRTKTLARNVGVIAMYEGLGWHVRNHFRLIGREYVTIVSPPTY
jgi:ribosomal protein S18 acetylase RimI-like enzyme